MCVPVDTRFGSENSSQLEFKLTAQRDMEQVQQPTTDPLQGRANWNGTKNCPTCDQDLTSFLWTNLFLLDPPFPVSQSPLPPFPFAFCQHRSALCPLIPHLKQVP